MYQKLRRLVQITFKVDVRKGTGKTILLNHKNEDKKTVPLYNSGAANKETK